MAEVAEREAARWPRDEPLALHPRLQGLTLEIILRAVFGLDPGRAPRRAPRAPHRRSSRSARGRSGCSRSLQRDARRPRPLGALPAPARRDRRAALRADRRAARASTPTRDDVLAMLLAARHEDGSPMSDAGASRRADDAARGRPRDHRLGAGLGVRAPRPRAGRAGAPRRGDRRRRRRRLPDGDDPGDAAPPAGAAERGAAAGQAAHRRSAAGTTRRASAWSPNAYLVHHDPDIYPDPYAFRPERFLDEPPGTYTWIPFGGGRRRCLGASFALLEMKIVLRAVLARSELQARGERHRGEPPPRDHAEPARRRGRRAARPSARS